MRDGMFRAVVAGALLLGVSRCGPSVAVAEPIGTGFDAHAFWQREQAIPAKSAASSARRIAKPQRSTGVLPPPPAYVRGRLTCAINVNRYLAVMGKPVTGSAAALSFVGHGRRVSADTPGAVQVSRRRGGGYVEVVLGGGDCLNPSSASGRWRVVRCANRRNVVGHWLA